MTNIVEETTGQPPRSSAPDVSNINVSEESLDRIASLERLPKIGQDTKVEELYECLRDGDTCVASSKIKRKNGFAAPYPHELARTITVVNHVYAGGHRLFGFRMNDILYQNMRQLIIAAGIDPRLSGGDHIYLRRANVSGVIGWTCIRDIIIDA